MDVAWRWPIGASWASFYWPGLCSAGGDEIISLSKDKWLSVSIIKKYGMICTETIGAAVVVVTVVDVFVTGLTVDRVVLSRVTNGGIVVDLAVVGTAVVREVVRSAIVVVAANVALVTGSVVGANVVRRVVVVLIAAGRRGRRESTTPTGPLISISDSGQVISSGRME